MLHVLVFCFSELSIFIHSYWINFSDVFPENLLDSLFFSCTSLVKKLQNALDNKKQIMKDCEDDEKNGMQNTRYQK